MGDSPKPGPGPRPNPKPDNGRDQRDEHNVTISEVAGVYGVAATLTSGVMASLTAQLPAGAFDPTFGPPLQQTLLVARGVFLTFLAMVEGLIKDPTTPQPTLPGNVAPTPTPPQTVAAVAAVAQANLSALQDAFGAGSSK